MSQMLSFSWHVKSVFWPALILKLSYSQNYICLHVLPWRILCVNGLSKQSPSKCIGEEVSSLPAKPQAVRGGTSGEVGMGACCTERKN